MGGKIDIKTNPHRNSCEEERGVANPIMIEGVWK